MRVYALIPVKEALGVDGLADLQGLYSGIYILSLIHIYPGLMAEDEYDLAGFAVGVCDKKEMITGENLAAGDVLIGMASTGVHSNGFSLVRKVFEKEMDREGLDTYYDELGKTLGETLLAPTRIYVKALKNVKNRCV